MKWFNEILTAAKSFLGMDHDATEQEVHEKLTSMKNIDALRADLETELRAKIEQEEGERYGAQIQAATERAIAAEQRAEELEAKLTEANTLLDSLQTNINQLRTDAEALQARIVELEKLPAASHTGGPPGTEGGKPAQRPYQQNPLYLKAQKIRGTRQA
jgi:DNA repair exonuclease SbcCD ATPase subunit